jgi:hypothetical protein
MRWSRFKRSPGNYQRRGLSAHRQSMNSAPLSGAIMTFWRTDDAARCKHQFFQCLSRTADVLGSPGMKTAFQVVGKQCEFCQRDIAFIDEGKICPHCGRAFHASCALSNECDKCREPLLRGKDTRPPIVSASSVRPSLSDTRILIFALVSFALLIGVIAFWLSYSLTHITGK